MLSTYHLKGASQNATEDIRIPQLILRFAIIGKLYKVRKWILFKQQGELLAVCCPVDDDRSNV